MPRSHVQKIEMIPIGQITVINPRARNRRLHREIIENIETIGLKRPITVRRRSGEPAAQYDLVCGEGRLEAFRILGATEIPAVVTDASESDCLVMSLVENIARRQHPAIEVMGDIASLHERGYQETEIAQKIGVSPGWVAMIITLLERGEERLLVAVETGLISVGFAIDIAKADHAEVQNVLTEAYAAGKIKGKKLGAVRRLLDQRMNKNKTIRTKPLGRTSTHKKLTPDDLVRLCHREAEKQRVLVKKSDYAQAKLLFIVEALKDLLSDEAFTTLLRAERLDTMPRALTGRITGEGLP
jgi:ParB family transcriptional regulator, chromosome partitioning protein